MMQNRKTLLIIGGGASGFFCALNAKYLNPSLKIYIIEKTGKLLSKVKVSGGGRCNVTHDCASINEMIKAYPRGDNFLKKAFNIFFTKDTIQWFLKRDIKLKSEQDGRMFPVTDSSQTIIDCFMNEVNVSDTEILLNREVISIKMLNDEFELLLSNGQFIQGNYVCITTGGFPKSSQFNWIKKLGHSIQEPVPSLFTFNIKEDPITTLMGVAIQNTQVKIKGSKFTEKGPVLITHWGFSGPCILKLSSFAARYLFEENYSFSIFINWINGDTEQQTLDRFREFRFKLSSQKFANRNPYALPQRLWEYLMTKCNIDVNVRWADLPAKQQNLFVKQLCAQEFVIKGKTTFKEEFVTSGGVNTSEIEVTSMESKIIPGVYFAGEILNIDGITGGYNFQSAWTTSYIAAKSISERSMSI